MGANEGLMVRTSLVETKANMSLAKLAGFRAVNFHAFWWPGVTEPREYDMKTLGETSPRLRVSSGIPTYVAVTNTRGRYAPQDDEQRANFAQFAANVAEDFPSFTRIIVGNEPNLNLFWQPQFDETGGNAAAVSYEKALATTYDAIKAVSPKTIVIGGAVSPRGHDNPNASTKSHSPTVFIRDLGAAYRPSGREARIMDWFAFHPYGTNSSESPLARHPSSKNITINDYDKLDQGPRGGLRRHEPARLEDPDRLRRVRDRIDHPEEQGEEVHGDGAQGDEAPSPPTLQGQRYREAIGLAFCQRTVRAMFLYHAFDEVGRAQWQSGVYYVDHKPQAEPQDRAAGARRGEARRHRALPGDAAQGHLEDPLRASEAGGLCGQARAGGQVPAQVQSRLQLHVGRHQSRVARASSPGSARRSAERRRRSAFRHASSTRAGTG